MASSFAKILSFVGIACRMSLTAGKGCTGRLTVLLMPVWSVTSQTLFPSGLGSKNAGWHQIEGLWTLVMTPLSIRSCSTFSASFSNGRGTLLVNIFLLGVAPVTSSIFSEVQFMGFGLSYDVLEFFLQGHGRCGDGSCLLEALALFHDHVGEPDGDAFQHL